MGYPHNLRAHLNPFAPEPTGVCDRCYFYYPLDCLEWQMEYRGRSLQRLGIRVCPRCLDTPNPQLQPVIIRGPEGTVRDPRPPQYALNAEGGFTLPTGPNFPLDFALEGDAFILDETPLDGDAVLGGADTPPTDTDLQVPIADDDTGEKIIDDDTGAQVDIC